MRRRNPFPIGERFGRLVVAEMVRHDVKRGAYFFSCVCDCGKLSVVREDCFRTGNTRSCGCLQPESVHVTHGMHSTRTYRIWAGLVSRCKNMTGKKAHLYAAKGIRVCKDWLIFDGFLRDMGQAPEGMSIERVDGSGNYEPSNCRWATPKEQANNTSKNRIVSYGERNMTISQWAEETGIKANTLVYRLRRGWAIDRALGYAK